MWRSSVVRFLFYALASFSLLALVAFFKNDADALSGGLHSEAVDSVLAGSVESLLHSDGGLDVSHLRVEARSGIVVLAGSIADERSQRRALSLISQLPGVRGVRDETELECRN